VSHIKTVSIEGRTFARGVRHVRTLTICGVRVPIVRATPEQVPELLEDGRVLDGYFCFERLIIVIRAGQSKTQERDSIVHETVHGFLYLSGARHQLKFALGPKFKGFEDFEELIVRNMTPHLVGLLECNGGPAWLR
jgi:hypothetical protein